MHINGACQCAGIISPNRAQEFFPRNAAPRSLDQIAEKVKLLSGESNGLIILGHFSKAKIQADRAELKNTLAGADGHASPLGFNAGTKFGGLERFCYIIIGPELKSYYLVGGLVTRAQNNQGGRDASFANGFAHI